MPETSDDQRALHARVVMMLKAPLEGYAKTRLASALGAPGAQDAYEELLKAYSSIHWKTCLTWN